jgi:hypothetical protein
MPKLAKHRQTLTIQAFNNDETLLAQKEVSFLADVQPESITIQPNGSGFAAQVQDGLHHPVTGRKVYFGCFDPVLFGEQQGVTTTNLSGQADFSCRSIQPAPHQYLYVAAGTDSPDRVRTSDLRIFKLGK